MLFSNVTCGLGEVCQVHPKTSANYTIWRSVSADRWLHAGEALPPQQHPSGVMTVQVAKPKINSSKHFREVRSEFNINPNHAKSNNTSSSHIVFSNLLKLETPT